MFRFAPLAALTLGLTVGLLTLPAAPAHAGEPIHVDGNVTPPVKISAPAPQYTQEARDAQLQGVVIMQTVIDHQGNVANVKILKDLPMGLGEQAKKAVSEWKFEPATLNDEPVDVYYNLTVNFRLDSKKKALNVTGDVQKPVKISAPAPEYTAEAKEARIQGVVIAQVIITKDGDVTDVKILKDLPMGLGQQAQEALSKWKFEPATLNGEPVDVYYNLTLNFRLE